MKISSDCIEQYRNAGFFVLNEVIPQAVLLDMRTECQRFIDEIDAEMERKGVDMLDLNHRGKRYFIANRQQKSPILQRFLFSDQMAEIIRATIGNRAYLFVEQFVVKAAEVGMSFGWHQDGGFIQFEPRPHYVSCWCTLDDVNEENGTVYMLPYERAGTKDYVEHVLDPNTNDRIGYHGDDPGVPVIAPAGSIAVFSSTTLHRSGPNTTPKMRRVYLAQYSHRPILNPETGMPHRQVIPFAL